jgi:integrase
LKTARGERLEALYVVAVQSGLRQGELLALRWEDGGLGARSLQVRRTVTRDGGKLAVGPTKTGLKGRRTVKLIGMPQKRYRVIWNGRQMAELDKAGDNCQENG